MKDIIIISLSIFIITFIFFVRANCKYEQKRIEEYEKRMDEDD